MMYRMSVYPMPTAAIVQNLISDLLDKKVAIKKCDPVEITPLPVVAVAIYESDEKKDNVAAICICNIEFASRIAAAFTMIPEIISQSSITDNKLSDALMDNFSEIMNVATSFFYNTSSPHVKLREIIMSSDEMPRNILHLIRRPADQIDLEIDIERYGTGNISLLINK